MTFSERIHSQLFTNSPQIATVAGFVLVLLSVGFFVPLVTAPRPDGVWATVTQVLGIYGLVSFVSSGATMFLMGLRKLSPH